VLQTGSIGYFKFSLGMAELPSQAMQMAPIVGLLALSRCTMRSCL